MAYAQGKHELAFFMLSNGFFWAVLFLVWTIGQIKMPEYPPTPPFLTPLYYAEQTAEKRKNDDH
jgi:hypothetical protein